MEPEPFRWLTAALTEERVQWGRSGSLPRLQPMSAEQVALIPQCAECYRVWLPDDGDRWQAYFDTDDELVFYCPECAEREFER
jgi:hypothetical protein